MANDESGAGLSSFGRHQNHVDSDEALPLVEFAVNVCNQDDLHKLDETLKRRGVKMVASNLDDKMIQVQFPCGQANAASLAVQSLQRYVEQETGFLAVVKGMGQLATAVAELKPAASQPAWFGVVWLSQMKGGACFVDGLIESTKGHRTGPVSLAIHEFGDLSSDNFDSIGDAELELMPPAQQSGRASISVQLVVPHCEVAAQIGKSIGLSLAIDSDTSHSAPAHHSRQVIAAGVIARASTIGGNKKMICACSGKTLWQERAECQKDQLDSNLR